MMAVRGRAIAELDCIIRYSAERAICTEAKGLRLCSPGEERLTPTRGSLTQAGEPRR